MKYVILSLKVNHFDTESEKVKTIIYSRSNVITQNPGTYYLYYHVIDNSFDKYFLQFCLKVEQYTWYVVILKEVKQLRKKLLMIQEIRWEEMVERSINVIRFLGTQPNSWLQSWKCGKTYMWTLSVTTKYLQALHLHRNFQVGTA